MKKERYIPNVVDLAHEIIDMDIRLQEQEQEIEELRGYKQKYNDLLAESLASSQEQAIGWLDLIMSGRLVKG